tara:strand:- start:239 stop:1099 length:861 start_codon:yes stop_codon:yes gene_type:complete
MSQQVNDDYPIKPLSDKQLKDIATAKYEAKPTENVKTYDFPTEMVELPSKGKLYPVDSPLHSGTIEMKYMSAVEEDILTNESFIKQGVVLDKLFKALIVTPINYNDLLLCDKNAVMIAARVLGYGKDYEITTTNPKSGEEHKVNVDLTKLVEKEIDWSSHTSGKNEFDFNLPASKRKVTLRLLTQGEQRKIDAELKNLAKLKRNATLTTTLKHVIIGVDGNKESADVRKFIDTELLAIDSRAIRQYLKTITPEIDLTVEVPDGESGDTFQAPVTIGLDFFWPDSEL